MLSTTMDSVKVTTVSKEQKHTMTIKQRLEYIIKRYEYNIKENVDELSTVDPAYQSILQELIDDAQEVWALMRSAGVYSPYTDQLDDLHTFTLQSLMLPYMVGDLWQRVQGSDSSPISDPRRPQSSSSFDVISYGDRNNRPAALANSQKAFKEYIEIAQDLGFVTDKEIEIYDNMNPSHRDARIQLHNRKVELKERMKQLEQKLTYEMVMNKRASRLKRIQENEDDIDGIHDGAHYSSFNNEGEQQVQWGEDPDNDIGDEEERGDDTSESKRELIITQLKWCVWDTFQQTQMSKRELEMLGGIPDSIKRQIADQYQENMEQWKNRANPGKQTYTILPGGIIAPGAPLTENKNFREIVKAEMFMQRNLPTMTLEEFAQMEMAQCQKIMEAQKSAKEEEEAENDMLGEDGREEKERQKQAAKDDWRDACPVEGITNKGNYS
eukprot:Tbor_TRINITY_DN6617_c0_g1::TRINITY_DN6617_c0_g1_i1::g.3051::m.3051/K17606/IGBP1, TAP42; immunoglobulin-binding protein 1